MEQLAKKYHCHQYRNAKKIPYFEHLAGVVSILTSTLTLTQECPNKALLNDLQQAAWGHDLLEDTDVSKQEILAASNPQVLSIIEELTNFVDDAHTAAYMKQLQNASQEARIIKYCDLIENTTSVCYGIWDLGTNWTENFYLPILANTTKVLAATTFPQFPQTASTLRKALNVTTKLLTDKLELHKTKS